MTAKILVVEDEAPLAELLVYNLLSAGYAARAASNGEDAIVLLREDLPDLVILDWMLPGISGLEVCRQLRSLPHTRSLPVIMLTARGEEHDRLRGLTIGADDFVVKPFSVPELMARVTAILRRVAPQRIADELVLGDIKLDRAARQVTRGSKVLAVGPTEFRLLEFIMENPGRVLSREQILNAVWGTNTYVDERTVDVHVGRLRKAINFATKKDPIRTVRGAGYVFESRGDGDR